MWKSPFYECISVRVVVMKKLSSCKGIIAIIVFSLIMICFASCQLWYQDLKGYLEHWSDTVSVEGSEWSASPESQKNSSGVDTVATNATISASVAISNPENYALNYEIGTSSDSLKSVRLTGATAVLSSARVISSSPSSIQVQIDPLSAVPTPESLALEHSDFTLQFIPVRSDSGLAAPTAESITLRYNTPPRMPLEVVYNKDSQQLDWMGSEGWKLVQQAHDPHLDNHIYWAWPRGITDPRHPDYVTKFQIYVDGALSQEGAPDNFKYTDSTFISPKLADYQVYRVAGTSGSKIEIYAVDPEDVTSFATGSGIAPHKITLTTDQGFFSSSGVDSLELYKAAGSLAIGSDFEAPHNPDSKYYLSGWTCDGNSVSFPLEISKPMELVAQWTSYPTDGGTGGTPGGDSEGTTGSGSASSSTYSITYDANGADSGTVPTSQTKLAGKSVSLAKNSGSLTKEHHTFSGWNTARDGSGTSYAEGANYTGDADLTLYAQWTKWNQVQPVQFNVGAGNVNFDTKVRLSTTTPNATIYYTVNGSGEQIGAVGQPVVITITSDATISAYATYDGMIPSTETSANYKLYTYTITYDGTGSDGGDVPGQQTKIDGYPVELAGNTGNLTKRRYTFNGWNTKADGSGTSYAEGSSFTDDTNVTLYAQWKKCPVTKIEVIPPNRTVYGVGDTFDSTGMVVTATYSDGESQKVTGWSTNFDEVIANFGLDKVITVSYLEENSTQTATFTVDVANYKFTETVQDYVYPAGKTGTAPDGIYKIFGDWPQTIKGEGVDIGSGTLTRGDLIYQVGSDGNYYVKVTANPDEDILDNGILYSNNSAIVDKTDVYFKVEPIVWRELTGSYGSESSTLLLAENILTGGISWNLGSNNYKESIIRKWLNSNKDIAKQSDYGSTTGFLKTAFTPVAQDNITETTVDNSAKSTSDTLGSIDEAVAYVCDDTIDKIFLLSEFEATYKAYGFAAYDEYVGDSFGTQTSTRIRVTTDYAKAIGAYQSPEPGQGGRWWLRSPSGDEKNARRISNGGSAISGYRVDFTDAGVVPALCINFP